MDTLENIKIDEILLKKIQFGVSQSLNLEEKNEGYYNIKYLETLGQHLLICLERNVLAEEKVNTIKVPKNWYESFKLEVWPRWLVNKFPVRYKEIEVRFDILYPDFQPSIEKNKYVIRAAKVSMDKKCY